MLDQKITQLAAAQLVTEEKIQGFDDVMVKLAAAQFVTEEKLQKLIDALRRGGNGSGQKS